MAKKQIANANSSTVDQTDKLSDKVEPESLKTNTANIDVTFQMGLGHLSTKLYRNQILIADASLRRSGRITLNNILSKDSISIDGICTGTTNLAMDINSDPKTPRNYPEGDIFDELVIV